VLAAITTLDEDDDTCVLSLLCRNWCKTKLFRGLTTDRSLCLVYVVDAPKLERSQAYEERVRVASLLLLALVLVRMANVVGCDLEW
jgi:hypothetical protein